MSPRSSAASIAVAARAHSAAPLDAADLSSAISIPLGSVGLDLVNLSNRVDQLSIGDGIVPQINVEGRVRGSLDLGNTDTPLRPEGIWLHLIASGTDDLATAAEAGISGDIFQIPGLPDPADAPPLPVESTYGGLRPSRSPSRGPSGCSPPVSRPC